MSPSVPIQLIGMPQDFGQMRRGVDMGPSALRVAGLNERLVRLGLSVIDSGDVSCEMMTTQEVGRTDLRFLDAVAEGSRRLADVVAGAVLAGRFPLVLGGDHSISIGTVAGLAAGGGRQGLIWLDAHADFNTPDTSPSGNIHGMALAVALGRGDPRLTEIASAAGGRASGEAPAFLEENAVIVGARDLDPGEREALRRSRVTVFTMRAIDEIGIAEVMKRALEIASRGADRVHLSLDFDVVDPSEAPGVGTPVAGGITFREAHVALEIVADSSALASMEIVEINPTLDERNRTSELAVGLVASALGQRIY